jgi:FixJ family two-component response regulator
MVHAIGEGEPPLIAVVDDDAPVRRALSSLLQSSGFRVSAFPSAAAFLAWPELAEAGCLILDLAMPEMSGSELVSHLRATQQCVPFVVLSASADNARLRSQMIDSGAVACLRKPASGSELLAAVRRAVAGLLPRSDRLTRLLP